MLGDMQLVFLVLIVTVICFFVPRFRSDMVAAGSLLTLYLVGVLNVNEILAGFSNSVVIMMVALFIIGEGVFQTGLAEKSGGLLVKWGGNSEFKMTIIMMLLVAVLSGFMSNTGTVAILIPVVVSLCRKMKIQKSKFLMPLAFASSIGGTLTLIGTPPNLLASQSLLDYGYSELSFFAFTYIGIICLIVGIAYLWFVARKMLDKSYDGDSKKAANSSEEELLKEYNIREHIHYVSIQKSTGLVGKTLKELNWPSNYNMTVLEVFKLQEKNSFFSVKKRTLIKETVRPSYKLQAEDILIIYANKDINEFINQTRVKICDSNIREILKIDKTKLAEIILAPQSQLIDKSIFELSFRNKYGLTILAVKEKLKEAQRPNAEYKLSYGDTILVYGEWKNINRLKEDKKNTIVLNYCENPTKLDTSSVKLNTAILILVGMVAAMMLQWFPVVVTTLIAAFLMILTGCVGKPEQAYKAVNWSTIILIASMLPMSTALEKTGGVNFISEGLVSTLGEISPLATLTGLYVISSVFSLFMSNTATAVLLYPIAILTSEQMGLNPVPMVMAVAFAASMSFATPIATPPNTLVMGVGKYTFIDFIRVGLPLQTISALCTISLVPIFYPF